MKFRSWNARQNFFSTRTTSQCWRKFSLPETFRCSQSTMANKLEDLGMLLRRTAHPCCYSDLILRFSRPVLELSMTTNCVVDYLYDNHGHRLTQWNHQIMSPPPLQRYADSVSTQGVPLKKCFGFTDGTVRPICRPLDLQEVVYNGHKQVHALKFQSLTLPFGLIRKNVCCLCNHSQCSYVHVWQSNISILCS